MSYNQLPLGLTEEIPNTNKTTTTHKLRKNKKMRYSQTSAKYVEVTTEEDANGEKTKTLKYKSFNPQPPGFKFIDTLSSVNYKLKAAIAEHVDNAIDAEATEVHVRLRGKGIEEIIVMDNGFGMDTDTLLNSYQLGADRVRRPSERGKFGLGGTAGSLSFADEKQTFTVDPSAEDFIGRGYSKKQMQAEDAWGTYVLDVFPSEYRNMFTEAYGEESTGTMIIHKDLRLKTNNHASIRATLKKYFGEIYFDFILNGKLKIFVDGVEVEASDPLKWDDPRVIQLVDEILEYNHKKFRLRVVDIIPIYWEEGAKACAFGGRSSVQSQGGYILRSHRVIKSALTNGDDGMDGFWTRYPNNQGLRWQVNMDGEMDNEFGISVQKNSVDLEVDLLNDIRQKVVAHAASARRRYDSRKNKDTESDRKNVISRAEKALNSDFVRPKRKRKRMNTAEKLHKNTSATASGKTLKAAKASTVPTRFSYSIVERDMGRQNVAFELQDDKIFINTEHPYVKKYYLNGSMETQNAVLIREIGRLAACEEIGEYLNEDIQIAFDNYHSTVNQKVNALVRQYS